LKENLNINEKKLVAGISLLFATRILGSSLIIPVFSIFANEMPHSTNTLTGLAIGIFGISQVIFQIPMGKLSDKFGRKEIAIFGLTIFTIGTILSGFSENIYQLIFARFFAGVGAVAGVSMAWLTSGIQINKRNEALSYVGMSIGFAAIISFGLSPYIYSNFGFSALFFSSATITTFAILFTTFFVKNNDPQLEKSHHNEKSLYIKDRFSEIYKNRDLLILNTIGFIDNFTMIAVFIIMPLLLKEQMNTGSMWKIYVPVALIGTIFMAIFSRKADSNGTIKIASFAFSLEIVGLIIPIFSTTTIALLISFILYYAGYCILSPLLPAAISRFPSHNLKGTVMSMFHSFRFTGTALGGLIGGILSGFNPKYLFSILIIIAFLALLSLQKFKDFSDLKK